MPIQEITLAAIRALLGRADHAHSIILASNRGAPRMTIEDRVLAATRRTEKPQQMTLPVDGARRLGRGRHGRDHRGTADVLGQDVVWCRLERKRLRPSVCGEGCRPCALLHPRDDPVDCVGLIEGRWYRN